MNERIKAAAKDHTLLTAHRGSAGGNIPCNTVSSYEIALRHGADMIEIDIAPDSDGKLWVFHPGKEFDHLRCNKFIKDMPSDEVEKLRYVNADGTPTFEKIHPLDEILSLYKNRCFINIDKFWENIDGISRAVRAHGMTEQVVVKTYASDTDYSILEEYAPDIPYMAMMNNEDKYTDMLLKRKINYLGPEVHFFSDDNYLAGEEYISSIHKKGLLIWANAIVYNSLVQESAGHNDDISLTTDPEKGWGWLYDRGFDILQTDWILAMKTFLDQRTK